MFVFEKQQHLGSLKSGFQLEKKIKKCKNRDDFKSANEK